MQFYGHAITSDSQFARGPIVVPERVSSALAMWLPLVVFAATIWVAQHSLEFASPDFSDDAELDTTPSRARQVSFIALGAYGAMLLLQRPRVPLAINVPQLACLVAVLSLIVMSSFWSENLELSLKRSMVPLLTAVGALGIAKHWRPYDACRFVFALTALFLLIGIGAEIASGAFFTGSDNRFAGTLHPNCQAVNCAALALASLALYRDPRPASRAARRLWLAAFFTAILFLLLTRSRTTTMAFMVGLTFLLTAGMPRGKKLVIAGCLAMVCLTSVLAVFAVKPEENADAVFLDIVKMGREQDTDDVASLTGRLPIWEQIFRDVADRPWLGYGYGTFWTPQRVVRYSYIHDWEFNHAHSAYLEVLLNVGIVGLVMGLVLIVSVVSSAERAFRGTGDCGYRLAAALLFMALFHGVLDGNFVIVGLETALALICISVVVLHQASGDDGTAPRAADQRELHA